MMKRGVGWGNAPMLPRRIRAFRRSFVFAASQIPEKLLQIFALVIALGLVIWKRYRVPVFAGGILLLCLVGTISHGPSMSRERRLIPPPLSATPPLVTSPPRMRLSDAKNIFQSLPSLMKKKSRTLTAGIEIVANEELVCIDGNVNFALKLHFPESLTPRKDLLRRCGVQMAYDFSLRAAMGTLQEADLMDGSSDTNRAVSVSKRLFETAYHTKDRKTSYECYAVDDNELCRHPIGTELKAQIAPGKKERQNPAMSAGATGDVTRTCFRSYVTLCKLENGTAEVDAPTCGAQRHPELHLLDLKSLFAVTDNAMSRLHELKKDEISSAGVAEQGSKLEENGSKRGKQDAEVVRGNSNTEFIELYQSSDNHVVACRLGPACRDSSGMFILPRWMREKEHLFKGCGFKDRVGFGLPADTPAISGNDLFGLQTPHAFLGQFLGGFLSTIVALDAALGSGLKHGRIRRACIHEDGSSGCKAETEKISPQIILHDAMKGGFHTSWMESLISKLPPGPKGPSTLFLSVINKSPRMCFQSIVGAKDDDTIYDEYLNDSNHLYEHLNISRTATLATTRRGCASRVTIFDFREDRAMPYSVRPILNVKELKNAIRFKSRSNYFSQFNGLTVTVSIINPRQQSFAELVEIMRKTDVLIAPHSAELANMIFLRKNAVVIEAMPFGYAAGLHENLAKKAGLVFARAVGRADRESFEKCIKQKQTDKLFKPEDGKKMLKEFDTAAEGATEGQSSNVLLEGSTMTDMRNCLIAQKIDVHPPTVAQVVMNLVTRGCIKSKAIG